MSSFPPRSAALLIGLVYKTPGDRVADLSGPMHDVRHMKAFLGMHGLTNVSVVSDAPGESHDFGQVPDPNETQEQASRHGRRSNLYNKMYSAVQSTYGQNASDFLLIYYSGHGMQALRKPDGNYTPNELPEPTDPSCTKLNGWKEEAIVPGDISVTAPLLDDDINRIVQRANPNTPVLLIFDSCNSGTIADLQYEYYRTKNSRVNKRAPQCAHGRIVSLGASMDRQTAIEVNDAEAWFALRTPSMGTQVYSGLMTGTLITSLLSSAAPSQNADAVTLLDYLNTQMGVFSNIPGVTNRQHAMLGASSPLPVGRPFFPLQTGSKARQDALELVKAWLSDYMSDPSNSTNIAKTILQLGHDGMSADIEMSLAFTTTLDVTTDIENQPNSINFWMWHVLGTQFGMSFRSIDASSPAFWRKLKTAVTNTSAAQFFVTYMHALRSNPSDVALQAAKMRTIAPEYTDFSIEMEVLTNRTALNRLNDLISPISTPSASFALKLLIAYSGHCSDTRFNVGEYLNLQDDELIMNFFSCIRGMTVDIPSLPFLNLLDGFDNLSGTKGKKYMKLASSACAEKGVLTQILHSATLY